MFALEYIKNTCCGCFRDINNIKTQNEEKLIIENTEITKYLNSIGYSDTLPFVPPIDFGKVIKVYDGDTITIAAKLPNTLGPIYRFSVRLLGIDSPEIKGKTFKEKELAVISRDILSQLIMGKIVYLRNVSMEKYGRILADVYLGDLHVNDWMLKNGYAIPYDGGTKHRPSEWDKESI
jgi:endonuclease YncB( thermonuclease family)